MHNITSPEHQAILIAEAGAALAAGLEVHILRAGSKSYLDIGEKRTHDIDVVTHHVELGCNLGVAPGEDFVIVDVDCKNGASGMATMRQMDLPKTRAVRTPSGGLHLYYQLPEGTRRIRSHLTQYPGIDFLSGLQNVVLPGSVVDGKCYTIADEADIAPLPDWLFNELNATDAEGWAGDTSEGFDEKQMASALADIDNHGPGLHYEDWLRVGMALHHESDGEEWGHRLWLNWSEQSSCHDPRKFAKSWASFGKRTGTIVTGGSIIRMANEHRQRVQKNTDNIFPELPPVVHANLPPEPVGERPNPGRHRQLGVGLAQKIPKARPWVYGRLAIKGYLSVLVGRGGSAKSTVALVTAVAVATGRDLLRIGEVKKAPVLFCTNEESWDELEIRLQAIMQHFGIDEAEIADLHIVSGYEHPVRIAELVIIDGVPRVRPAGDLNYLHNLAKEYKPGLIVLDPLVSLLDGISENDNQHMDQVAAILKLQASLHDAAILILHHTSKSGSSKDPDAASRGATALINAARVCWGLHRAGKEELGKTMIPPEEWPNYIKQTSGKSNLGAADGGRFFRLEVMNMPCLDVDTGELTSQEVACVGPTSAELFEPVEVDNGGKMRTLIADLIAEGREFPVAYRDIIAEERAERRELQRLREDAFGPGKEGVVIVDGVVYGEGVDENATRKPLAIVVKATMDSVKSPQEE